MLFTVDISDRNELVFLDLTHQQIVEDEDHSKPDATEEQLEQIGKAFEQSLVDESDIAEKFSNVTIRKGGRFRRTTGKYPPLRQSLVDKIDAAIALSQSERSKLSEIKGFLESLDGMYVTVPQILYFSIELH